MSHPTEYEAKIIDIDRLSIEEKLVELGAHVVFVGLIEPYFLDTPDKSLGEGKKLLRVRREGDMATLTFKEVTTGPDDGIKVAPEPETQVTDLEATIQIFENLGYVVSKGGVKLRKTYELNGAHIMFDKYQGECDFIPEFMEIEAPSKLGVYETAQLLGFAPQDCKSWTFNDLKEHYQ